jgi:hypothetical protein
MRSTPDQVAVLNGAMIQKPAALEKISLVTFRKHNKAYDTVDREKL